MKPSKPDNERQLFQSSFEAILLLEHPLCQLADKIDWDHLDTEFASCYNQEMGRPGNATRLMVGLHYLKHAFDESDESVVARWLENPYWQYFCGYKYMQHEFPINPSSMTRWRKRLGSSRVEELFKETLNTALREKYVKPSELSRVIVDTTVQEKAIAFPTDSRLCIKAINRLIKLSQARGIKLRQSYVRVSKKAFFAQGKYARANQFKRAGKEAKKLKTFLGRLLRDIPRKTSEIDSELAIMLSRAERILKQSRKDSNKLYSLDATEVECIGKGKAHKKYEFGCKVSVCVTHGSNWITACEALPGNPYDGHTLQDALTKSKDNTGVAVKEAYVDNGYKGHGCKDTAVYVQGQKRKTLTAAIKRKLKRRSAVEPTIGHLKEDNRMGRNYLKGTEGDKLNAIFAAAGYHIRKLLRAICHALVELLYQIAKLFSICKNIQPKPYIALAG